MECVPEQFRELIPLDDPDVILLDELAESITEAWLGTDVLKLTAVLAAEKPDTLQSAIDVADDLDKYEFISCSAEEYGRNALLELCGDQEIIDTVDGFIDWKEFGTHMMEADGITETEYGAIRRAADPAHEMTIQSPCM